MSWTYTIHITRGGEKPLRALLHLYFSKGCLSCATLLVHVKVVYFNRGRLNKRQRKINVITRGESGQKNCDFYRTIQRQNEEWPAPIIRLVSCLKPILNYKCSMTSSQLILSMTRLTILSSHTQLGDGKWFLTITKNLHDMFSSINVTNKNNESPTLPLSLSLTLCLSRACNIATGNWLRKPQTPPTQEYRSLAFAYVHKYFFFYNPSIHE